MIYNQKATNHQMKNRVIIKTMMLMPLVIFLLISCASQNYYKKEHRNVLLTYLDIQKKESKNISEKIYLSKKSLQNIFIVDALERMQYRSERDSCIRNQEFCMAKHFVNQNILNHYYSQLSKEYYFSKSDFRKDEVALVDFDKDMDNEDLMKDAFKYHTKVISKPLFSLDKKYALICQTSEHTGLIILVFKKVKEGDWQFYEYIDI